MSQFYTSFFFRQKLRDVAYETFNSQNDDEEEDDEEEEQQNENGEDEKNGGGGYYSAEKKQERDGDSKKFPFVYFQEVSENTWTPSLSKKDSGKRFRTFFVFFCFSSEKTFFVNVIIKFRCN